jgi:hypothetical protein
MTNATRDQIRYACPTWCQADDHPKSGAYNPYDNDWTGAPLHKAEFGTMTSGAKVEVYWMDADANGPQVVIAGEEMNAGQAREVARWLVQAAEACG